MAGTGPAPSGWASPPCPPTPGRGRRPGELLVLSRVTITQLLHRYACPDLIAREGYWARPVKESLARPGARLSFCLCPGDLGSLDLRLFVNNQHAGRHLSGLPAPAAAGGCWAVLDVYGSTVGLASIREEAVPVQVTSGLRLAAGDLVTSQVLARGQEAVQAFLSAQRQGTLPLYTARLSVVGQQG